MGKAKAVAKKTLWGVLVSVATVAASIFVYVATFADGTRKIMDLADKTCPDCIFWCSARTDDEKRMVVDALVRRYDKATDRKKPPLSAESFKRMDDRVDCLLANDPRNGHALYYRGTAYRWQGNFAEAEKYFNRYIEYEAGQHPIVREGDPTTKACYDAPHGYCRQRTAWILHQLANDYLKAALDGKEPARNCRRSVRLASSSLQLRAEGFDGADQGTETLKIAARCKQVLKT
jgi:hypothetical protein